MSKHVMTIAAVPHRDNHDVQINVIRRMGNASLASGSLSSLRSRLPRRWG
jgi:hypothetical protein